MKARSVLLFSVCLLAVSLPASALDWPQFRGPDRTAISKEKGLLKVWPRKGPKLLWTFAKTGVGFSGPAIVGDRLYIMGARKENEGKESEFLICLDIKAKPKELWAVKIGPLFTFKGNTWGDGPRGTPTLDGDRVYALGGQGNLICVQTTNQKVLWEKSLPKDFGGVVMEHWGYCESPLVDGEKLVCSPGGKGGTIIALNKRTGNTIWRCKELKDEATYGSMVVATIGGVRQYVQTTFQGDQGGRIVGVDADSGKLLWTFAQRRYNTAVASTPIAFKDYVYVSAGYGAGCNLLKIIPNGKKFKAQEVYKKPKARRTMKNLHGGVVLVGGYLYGFSDNRGWVCQKLLTGAEVWVQRQQSKLGPGCLMCAGGQLYLFGEDDGKVVLIDANPKGWKQHGSFEIPKKSQEAKKRNTSSAAKIWTHPVVSDNRLYLRDQEYLFCYDLKK
jgi:outer membrane protein assembly factor BamB